LVIKQRDAFLKLIVSPSKSTTSIASILFPHVPRKRELSKRAKYNHVVGKIRETTRMENDSAETNLERGRSKSQVITKRNMRMARSIDKAAILLSIPA